MLSALAGFDLEALLAPIAGDAPAGADPRESLSSGSRYFRLRDARSDARAAERLGDAADDGDSPPPQWLPVVRLGAELLTLEAKDIEVAAWCAEALLRTDGLPGLTAALTLMRGLVETYWDDLYPAPDEDGLATRVAPVAGLNGEGGDGTLAQPLRKIVLFDRRDGTTVPLWQFEQSAQLAGVGSKTSRDQRIAAGATPFDQMEADAQAAGTAHWAALGHDARVALDGWQALADALDQRAGADAPPTSRVRTLLADIVAICGRFAPAESGPAATVEPTPVVLADALADDHRGDRSHVTTREDALRTLGDVADFFRRTEPHSPLAFTLYEAVRRGRLTWPELLEEIVPDTESRSGILRSLGIRPAAPSE